VLDRPALMNYEENYDSTSKEILATPSICLIEERVKI
jgi:hypothetical protein